MPKLAYLLLAHPDDEVASWGLLQGSSDHYWVFVVLTRGEQTAFGDGSGLREDLGERVPRPQPFGGKGSEACRRQRIDSWHAFLDAMAQHDPSIDVPGPTRRVVPLTGPARGCEVRTGARSARVAFDLGDGALRSRDVVHALDTVRGFRGRYLPQLEEDLAVAGSYYNADVADSYPYAHRDHAAVSEALFATDHGLPGPQLGRTPRNSPAARERGRTVVVEPQVYQALMAVSDTGQRLGLMQTCYGWLAADPWPAGETDEHTQWSRSQTFWERF